MGLRITLRGGAAVEPPVAKDAPHAEPCCYTTPHVVPKRPVSEAAKEPLPLVAVE